MTVTCNVWFISHTVQFLSSDRYVFMERQREVFHARPGRVSERLQGEHRQSSRSFVKVRRSETRQHPQSVLWRLLAGRARLWRSHRHTRTPQENGTVCHSFLTAFKCKFLSLLSGLRSCKNIAHLLSWLEVVKGIPNHCVDYFVS